MNSMDMEWKQSILKLIKIQRSIPKRLRDVIWIKSSLKRLAEKAKKFGIFMKSKIKKVLVAGVLLMQIKTAGIKTSHLDRNNHPSPPLAFVYKDENRQEKVQVRNLQDTVVGMFLVGHGGSRVVNARHLVNSSDIAQVGLGTAEAIVGVHLIFENEIPYEVNRTQAYWAGSLLAATDLIVGPSQKNAEINNLKEVISDRKEEINDLKRTNIRTKQNYRTAQEDWNRREKVYKQSEKNCRDFEKVCMDNDQLYVENNEYCLELDAKNKKEITAMKKLNLDIAEVALQNEKAAQDFENKAKFYEEQYRRSVKAPQIYDVDELD